MDYYVRGSVGEIASNNKKITERFEFDFGIYPAQPEFNKDDRDKTIKLLDNAINKIKSEKDKDNTITYGVGAVIIQPDSVVCDFVTSYLFDMPCNPCPPKKEQLNSLEALQKFKNFLEMPKLADTASLANNAPTEEVMDRDMKQSLLTSSPAKPKKRFC